jgi:hypothetical protein
MHRDRASGVEDHGQGTSAPGREARCLTVYKGTWVRVPPRHDSTTLPSGVAQRQGSALLMRTGEGSNPSAGASTPSWRSRPGFGSAAGNGAGPGRGLVGSNPTSSAHVRVAQRESTAFTRRMSQVRSLVRALWLSLSDRAPGRGPGTPVQLPPVTPRGRADAGESGPAVTRSHCLRRFESCRPHRPMPS